MAQKISYPPTGALFRVIGNRDELALRIPIILHAKSRLREATIV